MRILSKEKTVSGSMLSFREHCTDEETPVFMGLLSMEKTFREHCHKRTPRRFKTRTVCLKINHCSRLLLFCFSSLRAKVSGGVLRNVPSDMEVSCEYENKQ